MNKKKLFFFGTPKIAVPSLEKLFKLSEIEIVGVGVPSDKKVGRKQILTSCAVKIAAEKLGLPVFEIANKSDLVQIFETKTFDLGIVIAFGTIFPEKILNIPKSGLVNVHFSLLPKYRGASPVQAAILNGDKISGITFQKMAVKLDTGDILLQKEFPVEGKKTSEVFTDFAEKTAKMFPEFVETYCNTSLRPVQQNDGQATYCRKFQKSDGEIFPDRETADEIYQKYLAFDIFPGIFLKTKKGSVKLTEISKPPTINAVEIKCAEGSIFVQRAQLPGKKEMPVAEILKGNKKVFEV